MLLPGGLRFHGTQVLRGEGFPWEPVVVAGVGLGPMALPRERQSVMDCLLLSLPVAVGLSCPSSNLEDGHCLTPRSLCDRHQYSRSS